MYALQRVMQEGTLFNAQGVMHNYNDSAYYVLLGSRWMMGGVKES